MYIYLVAEKNSKASHIFNRKKSVLFQAEVLLV